jgi:hypothetical protein
MHLDDRILVLEPIDGKKPLTTHGLVDTKLFKGGNQLHAVKDTNTDLWKFKYESGTLPDNLKQHFTSFSRLYQYAEEYFGKRNLRVIKVDG